MHPNGAAVFSEDKKFEFLLPWIIEAHDLLPPTPLFWSRDDNTIPLYRQTLWLHEDTIKWLAETGEGYPSLLHDQIAPYLVLGKPWALYIRHQEYILYIYILTQCLDTLCPKTLVVHHAATFPLGGPSLFSFLI